MVTLGVPCANFGMPFKERFDASGKIKVANPATHYPNVAFSKFDDSGALQVYKDLLRKEQDLTAFQKHVARSRQRGEVDRMRVADIMPGYMSIRQQAEEMGYTAHPISNQLQPPPGELPSAPRPGSGSTTRSARTGLSRSASEPLPPLQRPPSGSQAAPVFESKFFAKPKKLVGAGASPAVNAEMIRHIQKRQCRKTLAMC